MSPLFCYVIQTSELTHFIYLYYCNTRRLKKSVVMGIYMTLS